MLASRPLAVLAGLATLALVAGCSASAPATVVPSTTPSAQAASASPAPVAASSASTSSTSPSASAPTSAASSGQPVSLAVHRNADGSCTMPAAYAGQDFKTVSKDGRKVIALTFDGGASNAADEKILKILAEKDVTATFYFTGKFAEMYPDTVKTIAATYPIGNHSYTHPYFSKISDAKITEELTKAEAAIIKASGGVRPVPLFRFPYGDKSSHALAMVNRQCYVPFRWTIDTMGWAGTKTNSVAKILALVNANATPGGIILMHQGDNPDDHSMLDADALPQMIDDLRAKGYEFVTLNEALKG